MADKGGQPTSLAEAKRLGSPTYRPTTGRNKGKIIAAVSKEELKKSNMSLKEFLNKRRKDARKSGEVAGSVKTPKAKVPAPAPKAKASTPKRKTPAILKASPGADLSAPKPKSKPTGSSAPLNTKFSIVPSRGTGKADPYKYVGKGTRGKQGQAPIPTTEEKVQMAGLILGGLGGPGAKLATKAATTYGKPFVNKLVSRIKNLSNKQQEDIMKEIARSNLSKKDMNIALKNAETPKDIRTQIALRKAQASAPGQRAPGEKPFRQTTVKKRQEARNRQRRRETRRQQELREMNKAIGKKGGGNLKPVDTQKNPGLAKLPTNVRNRMGYAKSGGKVVNRKGGGMVGSGNDLVASMYD